MAEAEVTPCIVYGLWSERDRVIRYIGQTTGGMPDVRLSTHRRDARRGKKAPVSRWIAGEEAAGSPVRMKILHWHGDAAVSEIEFIALYRAMGAPLLNRTRGTAASGEERVGPTLSAEARKRIGDAHRGKRASESTRAKISARNAARWGRHAAESDYFKAAWPRSTWV